MGEAKQEEAKAVEPKAEAEKKEKGAKKEEEKKQEKKPDSPPPVVVLLVDLHCEGCVNKIERCLLRCKGVEEVETDISNNQVKIKGVVDPQALCSRIEKKTMRSAKVLSPPNQDPTQSQVVASQVEVTTVELHVNMHCEACAQQLKEKMLRIRGVQTAETDLSSGKLTVTGTMSSDKIVDYIYRRTGKLAKVIPPPSPPPPPPKEEEEKKDEGEKKAEEKPAEEKKEDNKAEKKEKSNNNAPQAQEKKEEDQKAQAEAATKDGKNKDEDSNEEEKNEGETGTNMEEGMVTNRIMYWNGGGYDNRNVVGPWMPVYFVERSLPPPPQIFSDENPNACCIS